MVFEYILRSRPRRRASHSVAEGFSPTASPAERMNFSETIIHPQALNCLASRMACATSRIVLRLFIASCWILRNASASLRPW